MRDSKEAVYDYLLSTLMSLMTETYFCTSLKHYIFVVYNKLYLDTSFVLLLDLFNLASVRLLRNHSLDEVWSNGYPISYRVFIFVYAFGMVCDNLEQNLGIGIELFLCFLCI